MYMYTVKNFYEIPGFILTKLSRDCVFFMCIRYFFLDYCSYLKKGVFLFIACETCTFYAGVIYSLLCLVKFPGLCYL
jgi:hypothetical protein